MYVDGVERTFPIPYFAYSSVPGIRNRVSFPRALLLLLAVVRFLRKDRNCLWEKKDEERLFFFAGWLVCLCEGGVVVAPPKSPPPCRFMWNYTPSDVNGGNATFIITRLRNLLTVAACYLLLASCCSSSPSDTADSNSGSFHASSIRVGKIIQKCCGN